MENSSLRYLFEFLCDQLEQVDPQLGFRAAYGLESPFGVDMVFVFEKLVMVCHFQHDEEYKEPFQEDECIDMIGSLKNHKGGFAELFDE